MLVLLEHFVTIDVNAHDWVELGPIVFEKRLPETGANDPGLASPRIHHRAKEQVLLLIVFELEVNVFIEIIVIETLPRIRECNPVFGGVSIGVHGLLEEDGDSQNLQVLFLFDGKKGGEDSVPHGHGLNELLYQLLLFLPNPLNLVISLGIGEPV